MSPLTGSGSWAFRTDERAWIRLLLLAATIGSPGGSGIAAGRVMPSSFRLPMTCRYPEGILATCPVPWTEAGEFDEERFRASVRLLRNGLTRSIYIFGTAGEGNAVGDG